MDTLRFVYLNLFNKDIELFTKNAIEPIPNLREEIEINGEFYWIARKTFNYEKREIKLICMKSGKKY